MKTAILFGAGSSLAAGFPSTQRLTDLVLSGEKVWRHTDEVYYTDGRNPPDEKTRLAKSMVRRLCVEAERYYLTRAGRPPNYEDLHYLARQVYDEVRGETESPAVLLFAERLAADPSQLITGTGINWCDTLRETCNYITDIVWHQLCCRVQKTNHLRLIVDACESGQVTSISTLCHDTHVEKFLADQDISLANGFSEPRNGVRYWNADLSSNDKIPFLKLTWFHRLVSSPSRQ